MPVVPTSEVHAGPAHTILPHAPRALILSPMLAASDWVLGPTSRGGGFGARLCDVRPTGSSRRVPAERCLSSRSLAGFLPKQLPPAGISLWSKSAFCFHGDRRPAVPGCDPSPCSLLAAQQKGPEALGDLS